MFGPLSWGVLAVSSVVGGLFLATGNSATDYASGGIAVAAIGFAGTAMKYFGGQVDKERARGDRLELALIDKVLPALASASMAMTQAQEAIKEMRARS